MNNQDPVAAFRIEAAELLEQIENALLDLNGRLDDRGLIDEVFRGLHTLKGSGAMFGFDALAGFTHHCESAFDAVRKGLASATIELVSVILSAKDHMRQLIDGDGEAVRTEGDHILTLLEHAVAAAKHGPSAADLAPADTASLAPVAHSISGWKMRFFLPEDCMANGTNPLILLDELRDLGDCRISAITDRVPNLETLNPKKIYIGWDVELRGDIAMTDIEDVFIFVMDDMVLDIEPIARAIGRTEPSEASGADTPTAPLEVAPPATATPSPKAEETVRVPAERLDELMDRVGELVIAQSRLSQIAHDSSENAVLRAVSEEIERLAGELRDTMMVLRMVPISTLFGRFRRLVHDLARETGKRIDLITEGESTEVDKTVVERLADPLVHLIRNACDHGLESSKDRLAAGKGDTGTVRLAAEQSGDEIIITICDDGRGINKDAVRAKAEAQGLITAGQTLSDQDLFQMIFHPGFSTAAQVTNLSGRGVGMDVVKRTIESLRGTIHISSVPQQGSVITLRIPLTLAIIEGLLVRVGHNRYVIPLAAVEECLELSSEQNQKVSERSFIALRDSLVPFLHLREVFACAAEPDALQKVVVIATARGRVGLVVDQIIGSHQTVIRSMSLLHQNIAIFAGATILGDGGIALILDVAQLIDMGRHQEELPEAGG